MIRVYLRRSAASITLSGIVDKFRISGGRPLHGRVSISGAKNSALPCMAAALLTPDTVTLHNIPYVRDIITQRRLLEDIVVDDTRLGNIAEQLGIPHANLGGPGMSTVSISGMASFGDGNGSGRWGAMRAVASGSLRAAGTSTHWTGAGRAAFSHLRPGSRPTP